MPRMDGFELTRRIKVKHRLPVILVTGMGEEEHRRKGLEAGADAYVVKSTFQGTGCSRSSSSLCEHLTGARLRTFAGHRGIGTSVAISHAGRFVASGNSDKTILIWDNSQP